MVREFGLFATTFRRPARQEIIAPNSPLSGSQLVHTTCAAAALCASSISVSILFIMLWETTNLMVSCDTPLEVLEELRVHGHWTPTSPRPTASGSTSIYLIRNRIVAMERQSRIST
ncbi:hypothetical protein B0H17DRAFT_1070174 [Mycena rosella]|uniref:Uncharacterized protein n=1 Tax=Mycena rosella TaxID=1033263 RepID=A0AAD7DB26_MYCRO|nr:hypothetical protein B0H17DRAFT_1070174 [Mycena rosella]